METTKVKFSQSAVDFIAKYMIEEFGITGEINEDMLYDIYDIYVAADDYDSFFATREIDPQFVFDEEKSKAAGEFTAEYDSVVLRDKTFDLDDLNRRLGLRKTGPNA